MRQTGRDLAELHHVVVDAATCAAVVFDDHVALDDGVPRAQFEHAKRPWGLWRSSRTQGSRERFFLLQSRRCASCIDEDVDVCELDSLAAKVSRCTSALEFPSEWPGCQHYHRG